MRNSILIIEDDPDEFEKLRGFVEEMNYDVLPHEFSDMISAMDSNGNGSIENYTINQVKENYKTIRLILCDIRFLNDKNGGVKVVQKIRDLNDQKKITPPFWPLMVPIIAITSFADLQENILIAGANLSIVRRRLIEDPDLIKTLFDAQIRRFELLLNATTESVDKDKNKVFIVHGHDSGKKETVARYLEKQGLEAVILHEQDDEGETIIEKFEKHSDVDFAIVLYTKDDDGKSKKESKLKDRARQNVVFEHGYMMSKLGRNKVCALIEKGVELPGDTSGIVYVEMDENGGWKNNLGKRMEKQGVNVDLSKIL